MSSTPKRGIADARREATFLLRDLKTGGALQTLKAAERLRAVPYLSAYSVGQIAVEADQFKRRHALDAIAIEWGQPDWRALQAALKDPRRIHFARTEGDAPLCGAAGGTVSEAGKVGCPACFALLPRAEQSAELGAVPAEEVGNATQIVASNWVQEQLRAFGVDWSVFMTAEGRLWIVDLAGAINVSSLEAVAAVLEEAKSFAEEAAIAPRWDRWIWNRLGGDTTDQKELACSPFVPCFLVEYDLDFWGGSYNDVGSFAYIPFHLVDSHDDDSLRAAFQAKTGFGAEHIIHMETESMCTEMGDPWDDDIYGSAELIIDALHARDRVPAIVYDDSRVFEVSFDARRWLGQASEEEVLALASEGWGSGYAADRVAVFHGAQPDGRKVASLLELTRAQDGMGFECHVSKPDALRWLEQHRPQLAERVRVEYGPLPSTWFSDD